MIYQSEGSFRYDEKKDKYNNAINYYDGLMQKEHGVMIREWQAKD
jgi:hypothetical protein